MLLDTWINDEDYVIWLWQTSHTSLQRVPTGTRPFAEAAVHALLATLRATDDLDDLRHYYQMVGPESLGLIRSILPIGTGNPASGLMTDADYEWLLVLEDAAFFLRYCEIAGCEPGDLPGTGASPSAHDA
jgi:hypothetical protein